MQQLYKYPSMCRVCCRFQLRSKDSHFTGLGEMGGGGGGGLAAEWLCLLLMHMLGYRAPENSCLQLFVCSFTNSGNILLAKFVRKPDHYQLYQYVGFVRFTFVCNHKIYCGVTCIYILFSPCIVGKLLCLSPPAAGSLWRDDTQSDCILCCVYLCILCPIDVYNQEYNHVALYPGWGIPLCLLAITPPDAAGYHHQM